MNKKSIFIFLLLSLTGCSNDDSLEVTDELLHQTPENYETWSEYEDYSVHEENHGWWICCINNYGRVTEAKFGSFYEITLNRALSLPSTMEDVNNLVFNLSKDYEFRLLSEYENGPFMNLEETPFAGKMATYRNYSPYYKGVKMNCALLAEGMILNGTYRIGEVVMSSGTVFQVNINPRPRLSQEGALQIAESFLGHTIEPDWLCELQIGEFLYVINGEKQRVQRLYYYIHKNDHEFARVDAHTGRLFMSRRKSGA